MIIDLIINDKYIDLYFFTFVLKYHLRYNILYINLL
jgi:hypothetical protein